MRFGGLSAFLLVGVTCMGYGEMAVAAERPASHSKTGLVLQGEIEFGGDSVATVNFTNGSTQDVKAGQGVTLAMGGYFRPNQNSPYGFRMTAGYKFVTTKASNADIELTRIPIELVGTYQFNEDFWGGVGPVYHTNIKFHGGGLGSNINFKSALGSTLELGWRWVALSYTYVNYKPERYSLEFDASSVGLTFASKF